MPRRCGCDEQGGVEIGGERYRVEIISIDDQLDPKRAIDGAQSLLNKGVRYIIGPNVDTTAAVIVPLLRTGNAANIAYGFGRYLYAPPQRHSILGMIASYQASPILYNASPRPRGDADQSDRMTNIAPGPVWQGKVTNEQQFR